MTARAVLATRDRRVKTWPDGVRSLVGGVPAPARLRVKLNVEDPLGPSRPDLIAERGFAAPVPDGLTLEIERL